MRNTHAEFLAPGFVSAVSGGYTKIKLAAFSHRLAGAVRRPRGARRTSLRGTPYLTPAAHISASHRRNGRPPNSSPADRGDG